MTKITGDMVMEWFKDGIASAINEVADDADQIAAQMTAEICTNKSKTSRNTIRVGVCIESNEIVREIPNPNQGELAFDATTPEPTDDETDEDEDSVE